MLISGCLQPTCNPTLTILKVTKARALFTRIRAQFVAAEPLFDHGTFLAPWFDTVYIFWKASLELIKCGCRWLYLYQKCTNVCKKVTSSLVSNVLYCVIHIQYEQKWTNQTSPETSEVDS